jgi:hypothetical protein
MLGNLLAVRDRIPSLEPVRLPSTFASGIARLICGHLVNSWPGEGQTGIKLRQVIVASRRPVPTHQVHGLSESILPIASDAHPNQLAFVWMSTAIRTADFGE